MNKVKIIELCEAILDLENRRIEANYPRNQHHYINAVNAVHAIRLAIDEPAPAAEPKTAVNFGPGKDGAYTVQWQIDVTAASVRDAAIMARNQMIVCGDNDVFDVWPKGETAYCTRIDLARGTQPAPPAVLIAGDLFSGMAVHGPYLSEEAAYKAGGEFDSSVAVHAESLVDPSDEEWSVQVDGDHVVLAQLSDKVGMKAYGPFSAMVAWGFAQSIAGNTLVLEMQPV